VSEDDHRSYYGRPILKEPVWRPEIPFYLFSGGLAGGSAVLSTAARRGGHERVARTSLYLSAVADLASPALLIADLGRPERFLNMLRMFKVTSPMSVGSWILAASGGASTTAAALEFSGRLRPLKQAAEAVSTALGPALATYTGTLLADTAIPVWHEARRELPFLFGASAAATAGAAATLFLPPEDAAPARRVALSGTLIQNLLFAAMQARLGMLGEPYRQRAAGRLAATARGCSAAGVAVLARGGRTSRAAAVAGSLLVLGGELALRWSVFKAGFQSARDPKYTVIAQRRRLESRAANAASSPGTHRRGLSGSTPEDARR
jgi:DMSO reductase anchor subunit